MKEELLAMQVQIDLMSRVIAELVSKHSERTRIEINAFKAAREKAMSSDPVVAQAAKEWGAKWFPHKPWMDEPWNQ